MINLNMDFNNEPFIHGVIKTLKTRGFQQLRKRSNIMVKKSARLMGVIDEYGVLAEDEVYAALGYDDTVKKQYRYIEQTSANFYENRKIELEYISGFVVIGKNPCLHPGDIRVMRAVTPEELKKRDPEGINRLQHLINVIVFPQKGEEPVTCKMSGSDLDGDHYFFSWGILLYIYY